MKLFRVSPHPCPPPAGEGVSLAFFAIFSFSLSLWERVGVRAPQPINGTT